MGISPTLITELVCTRISHDLIGNIGAISNAMELWDDDPSDLGDLKPLLEGSSKTLSARLKFFRLAFGLKNAAPKELSELNSIIDAYLASIGNPQMPIKMKSGVANVSLYKIVMLAVMGLSDVFVRGGQIIVDETDEGLSFEAVSDFELSASKLENINKAIKGVLPDDNPALLAPIVYLSSLINEVGVKLILEYQTKRAVLSVR
ncbi:MAG: hypothetical protein IKS23_03240 [Alphaproteobacteria bacterium]|nr:hypothetical protein [Alphaproteobacteria bacterium]